MTTGTAPRQATVVLHVGGPHYTRGRSVVERALGRRLSRERWRLPDRPAAG